MFYLKLAGHNIRKSLSLFAPFLLSSLVLYSLLSSLFLLLFSPVMKQLGSGGITIGLGVIVLTLFSLIMEIYSFRFLLKQRAREFGLYSMLGMNKRKISLIASFELLMVFVFILLAGSALAAVFSNVLYLLFVHLTHYADLHFAVSPLAFACTALIFLGIFLVLEGLAIWTIQRNQPLLLFRTSEKGEKEPRGNLLFAALSVLALGTGYFLSLSSSGMGSLLLIFRFFQAVLCVIVGTYLFYISFISWFLKKRRQNKTAFYTPERFITTSQLLFRMKQHATGLANITLLATMSFVTIATTTSLYTGMMQYMTTLYPRETSITVHAPNREEGQHFLTETVLKDFPDQAADALTYMTYLAGMPYDGGAELVLTPESLGKPDYTSMKFVYVITQDDFRALGNDLDRLEKGQVAFMIPKNTPSLQTLRLGETVFENVVNLNQANFPDIVNTMDPALLIVSDEDTLLAIRDFYSQFGQNMGTPSNLSYRAFVDLTDQELARIGSPDPSGIGMTLEEGDYVATIFQRKDFESMLYGFTGGFLFTGFLLGMSFLLGAALIIYYKQYTEGHEDQKSYRILQEVGMSQEAIKKGIRSQVLLVFFLPLGMATLHFLFSLVMLRQILLKLGIISSSLIYIVSGLTIAWIGLLYYLVYKWTSKTYYRIIERKNA